VKLPLRLVALLSLSLPFGGACASSPDRAESSSAAIVSPTTTYLLPVDDGVREACRATWSAQYCDPGAAQAAGDACVSAYLAAGGKAACAGTAAGCFEPLTTASPCSGERPIYPSPASCSAPVARTCAFYAACLEAALPCGETGYAIGYGEKYCSRYDVDGAFSPQGVLWRNAVLNCLQRELVTILPAASSMTCDAVTTFAFDSHPHCYTAGPSICFLPLSDVANVVGVIDGKDLLSLRSAKQMASVAATCVEQLAGALFDLDANRSVARVPEEARDRSVLSDRLAYWRDLQARTGE